MGDNDILRGRIHKWRTRWQSEVISQQVKHQEHSHSGERRGRCVSCARLSSLVRLPLLTFPSCSKQWNYTPAAAAAPLLVAWTNEKCSNVEHLNELLRRCFKNNYWAPPNGYELSRLVRLRHERPYISAYTEEKMPCHNAQWLCPLSYGTGGGAP